MKRLTSRLANALVPSTSSNSPREQQYSSDAADDGGGNSTNNMSAGGDADDDSVLRESPRRDAREPHHDEEDDYHDNDTGANSPNESELWRRLDGSKGIAQIVNAWHDKMRDDPLFEAVFLVHNDRKKAIRELYGCASLFLRGPTWQGGKCMLSKLHKFASSFVLEDSHFEALATHLREALEQSNVDPEVVISVIEKFSTWKDCMLEMDEWDD